MVQVLGLKGSSMPNSFLPNPPGNPFSSVFITSWILALLITSTLAHTAAIFGWDQCNNHLTPLLASAKWCCSFHCSAQNPPPASTIHPEQRSMSYLSPKALSDLPLDISDYISYTHSVPSDLTGSSPHQASSCLRISALAVNCFPGPLQWCTPWAPAGLNSNIALSVRPSLTTLCKKTLIPLLYSLPQPWIPSSILYN